MSASSSKANLDENINEIICCEWNCTWRGNNVTQRTRRKKKKKKNCFQSFSHRLSNGCSFIEYSLVAAPPTCHTNRTHFLTLTNISGHGVTNPMVGIWAVAHCVCDILSHSVGCHHTCETLRPSSEPFSTTESRWPIYSLAFSKHAFDFRRWNPYVREHKRNDPVCTAWATVPPPYN